MSVATLVSQEVFRTGEEANYRAVGPPSSPALSWNLLNLPTLILLSGSHRLEGRTGREVGVCSILCLQQRVSWSTCLLHGEL